MARRMTNYIERAVGTSSTVLLPADPHRYSFTISNGSANLLHLAFQGQAASTNSYHITSGGGQYTFTRDVFGDGVAQQVNAFYDTAGATIGVLVGLDIEQYSAADGQ